MCSEKISTWKDQPEVNKQANTQANERTIDAKLNKATIRPLQASEAKQNHFKRTEMRHWKCEWLVRVLRLTDCRRHVNRPRLRPGACLPSPEAVTFDDTSRVARDQWRGAWLAHFNFNMLDDLVADCREPGVTRPEKGRIWVRWVG